MSVDLLGLDDLDDCPPPPPATKRGGSTANSAFEDLLGLGNDGHTRQGNDIVAQNASGAVSPGAGWMSANPSTACPEQDEGDTDDWGDFEDAPPPPSKTGGDVKTDTDANWTAPTSTDFLGLKGYIEQEHGRAAAPAPKASPRKSDPQARDPDVLFDVDDENWDEQDDDDDFGDFEDVFPEASHPELTPARLDPAPSTNEPEAKPNAPVARIPKGPSPAVASNLDLLGDLMEDVPAPATASPVKEPPTISGAASFGATTANASPKPLSKPKPAPKPSTPVAKPSKPVAKPPKPLEDDWEDFEQLSIAPSPPASKTALGPFPKLMTRDGAPSLTSPPSNIPPPSILLPIFTPLLHLIVPHLITPLNALPPSARSGPLTDATILTFLRTYLALVRVLARVLTGRHLRWQRDTRLAQGMKISASGRSGGLKLMGVDRGEKEREDSAAADALEGWTAVVGRVRQAVVKARGVGSVPVVKEGLEVKALDQAEGGIPARGQCALCGLKRDERVMGVDKDVVDAFGEWWAEEVQMHAECRTFWESHREQLRQR